MRNVPALTKRELLAIFFSPAAYVALTVFLVISGAIFSLFLKHYNVIDFRDTIYWMAFCLIFLMPVITMRTLAEEKRSGTMETLMTDPVTDFEVVVGKFLGAMGFLLFLVAPTSVYVAIAASIGDPMYRPILSGYVGLMLIGAFYCAVGMLASSLTRNQVVSAALGFVILLVLYLGKVAGAQISGPAAQFLEYISPQTHLEDFTTGVFNTRDLVYYVSGIVLILFLTIRVVEMRKWR